MATEGPLIHDGGNLTAAANYSGGTAGQAGPGSSGQFLAVYISASRAVSIAATAGQAGVGIMQNTPSSGAAADVGILGVTKAVAGTSTVTAGAALTTDASGRMVAQTGTQVVWGEAYETVSATNQVFTMLMKPPIGPQF